MQTYLFYDIETTGLNKAFDQVLHFAAIRTDLQMREIERYELKVKLNVDTIPAPGALITHHISIEETLTGIPEIEAIVQIHQWLNTPGTISIGYNTLGFDDEFLRFSFYRHLLPPYTHQYANQCSRMDLYPITVMYKLFKNDILQWPADNLKLENINLANQLVSGRSHHAMVDVEVTLALAKRFMAAPEMWDYVLGYFNKQLDQERFQQLPIGCETVDGQHREGLMLFGKFGNTDYFQAPVLYIGESKPYKNQHLWLRLDSEKLRTTTEETIAENTWAMRKKFGEPGFILPAKERFLTFLSAERQTLAAQNKAWLNQNPELFQKIIIHHRNFTYTTHPETDIDASLYINGFWSDEEMFFCRRFHKATPEEKAQLTHKVTNPKLQSLAIRLLGRHYPHVLTDEQKQHFAEYLIKINPRDSLDAIIDFKGQKRLTPLAALAEIVELRKREDLIPIQHELLNGLEIYLQQNYS